MWLIFHKICVFTAKTQNEIFGKTTQLINNGVFSKTSLRNTLGHIAL